MTPTPIPATDAVQTIKAKLDQLAQLTIIIAAVEAEQQQKVQAIKEATDAALASQHAEAQALTQELEALALEHREALFKGRTKTWKHNEHSIALRSTDGAIECDDEATTLELLEWTAANHEDPAHRMAAAACLRRSAKIDKTFVKQNWDSFREWFTAYFGFRRERKDTVKINLSLTPHKG